MRFTAACVKLCVCCRHAAQLLQHLQHHCLAQRQAWFFRMPIQACEAQEKVIHCAELSDQQKGQMLSLIISYPDRALPLFEVPEYLLAHTLSAHLQGPPAGTSYNSVLAVVLLQTPLTRSCCVQCCGGVLLLKLPEPSLAWLESSSFLDGHVNVLICCGFRLW